MAKSIELKNVKVSFSTMLNKLDSKLYGRMFKVLVPLDSPQLKETIAQYKALNEQAKQVYSEQLGKKLKNAKSVDEVFAESIYKEGFVELNFNIYYVRKKEVEQEDGTKVEKLVEALNPIYSSSAFCYRLDNNGKKEYELENGKQWVPLSDNTINIKYSLVAGYSKKDNRPTIQLKADEVQIVDSNVGNKSTGPKIGLLTLTDENEQVEEQVSNVKPVEEDEMFTASELAGLDV